MNTEDIGVDDSYIHFGKVYLVKQWPYYKTSHFTIAHNGSFITSKKDKAAT